MNTFVQGLAAAATPSAPMRVLGLRRKCGCGVHGTNCARCRAASRASLSSALLQPAASSIEALPASLDAPARVRQEKHEDGSLPAYDFTRLPLNASREILDGNDDDEGLESVNAPPQLGRGTQPSPVARPTGTRVDTSTSFTQDALKAGFLTGMGIVARMQVLPDSTTWDGNEVVESVQQTSSTCPESLTRPGPCNGHCHFPIGGAMRGRGVRPAQPAMRNRYYDVHTSQSLDLSVLHDPTRNPKGVDACQSVCRKDYAFDGTVIGSHSIRRQFRKGTFGGHDVTIVEVSKSDLAPAASAGHAAPAAAGSGGPAAPPPSGGGGS
jgi:hypothetical protein